MPTAEGPKKVLAPFADPDPAEEEPVPAQDLAQAPADWVVRPRDTAERRRGAAVEVVADAYVHADTIAEALSASPYPS